MEILKNIIGPSCVSAFVYKGIYNTPLAWSLFMDDYQYLKFLENYDYYINLSPEVGIIHNNTFFSNQKIGDPQKPYVGIQLEDVLIHWIHTNNIQDVLLKWHRRINRSKDYEKIFIMSTPEFKKCYSDEERIYLINRFNKLDGFKILLTENPNENMISDDYIAYCVPEWVGKSQLDRTPNGDVCNWNNQTLASDIIRQILKITNKIS